MQNVGRELCFILAAQVLDPGDDHGEPGFGFTPRVWGQLRRPEDIRREYPHGVRKLVDGGTCNTIAGQPTDDSEMALMLARMLIDQGTYNAAEAMMLFY